MNSNMILLEDRLGLSFRSSERMRSLYTCQGYHFFDIVFETWNALQTQAPAVAFGPVPIGGVTKFCLMMRQLLLHNAGKTIVACSNRLAPEDVTTAALLIGSFMILCRGKRAQDVEEVFQDLSVHFICFADPNSLERSCILSVQDAWEALEKARHEGWIDLNRGITPGTDALYLGSFDQWESEHYARKSNGNVRMVIPGKMIIFPRPVDLPDGRRWQDDTERGRLFSPHFYADLFKDEMDVSVVLCLNDSTSSDYDRTIFEDQEIEVDEMHVEGHYGLLSAMSRFLDIAKAAPGHVAIHTSSEGNGGGTLGTFAVSYLINRLGFRPKAAVAWVRMVYAELLVPLDAAPALEVEGFVRLKSLTEAHAANHNVSNEVPAYPSLSRSFSLPNLRQL